MMKNGKYSENKMIDKRLWIAIPIKIKVPIALMKQSVLCFPWGVGAEGRSVGKSKYGSPKKSTISQVTMQN